jgi:hypothetical protein
MVERLLEVGFLLGMAGKAQLCLFQYEQVFQLRVMHGMAGSAANAILVVGGAHEFALLRVTFMTGHATPGNCLRLCPLEGEDLALIAASLNMGRPGAMA